MHENNSGFMTKKNAYPMIHTTVYMYINEKILNMSTFLTKHMCDCKL